MPNFEYLCPECGYRGDRLVPTARTIVPCPQCKTELERQASMPAIRADHVPGGFVIENLYKEPKRFDSKSQYRDELAANGCCLKDDFVQSAEGTDKNPNCGPRWTGLTADSLRSAEALMRRLYPDATPIVVTHEV